MVQFAETDLAGIVHFSVFFRYMEEAEHALWRAAGLSIADDRERTGWPRVSAAFEFRSPLRFEEQFDVAVTLARVTTRRLSYDFVVTRGKTLIGVGTMTTAHIAKGADGTMTAIQLPAEIVSRLRGIAGEGRV